ncbi:cupin domain-containing protein [candidate division FCPU426 bacterium]|nr:cupin domain-containing protein [candidate division FCPU426 bacterium]
MRIEDIKKHANFQPDRFGRSVIITSENSVLFLYSFKPGQAMTEHSHPFSQEYLTIIEGEAVISVGVESVIAKPYQVIFVPREEIHAIYNYSRQPLLITSFMSPKP